MENWISEYYLVLISGIAVPPICWIFGKLFKLGAGADGQKANQKQNSGKGCVNIQVGGNFEVHKKHD